MTIWTELFDILGTAGLLVGEDVPQACVSDESRTGEARPAALLRPANIEQTARALAVCARHGRGVTPQGGMSGLAGAANPRAQDVALSMDRFAGVESIDADDAVMIVRAGTTLEAAQRAADEAGLHFPIDLGARGSARIGGIVATNAGGLHVLRYGGVRANLLGLEAVLADGGVLSHLNRSPKDNTGYALEQLFVGSEGTLGMVTRAAFRLWPAPPADREVALCALPSDAAAIALFRMARARVVLRAFEAMWPDYFALSCALEGRSFFARPPAMIALLEAEGALTPLLEEAFDAGFLVDALPAASLAEARAFWSVREGVRIDAALPGVLNFDVGIALGAMPDFVARLRAALAARCPDARTLVFGHLGDGNLHVMVHRLDADEGFAHGVDAIIYGEVARVGGAMSAEHGIGTLKRDWLGVSRSPQEIAAMRAIKRALDPVGIMNPGKIFL